MEYLTPRYTQLLGSSSGVSSSPPDDTTLRHVIVGSTVLFTLFVFALESYLSLRQRSTYRKTKFPRELEVAVGNIDAEEEERRRKGGGREKEDDNDDDDDAKKVTNEEEKKEEGKKKKKKKEEEGLLDRSAPLLPQLRSKFAAAQSYGLDKVDFSLLSSAYSTFEGTSFVLLGFLPYAWDTSCRIGRSEYLKYTDESNDGVMISLIFLGLTTIVGTLTSMPFELYSTFAIERKHGFNKTTLGLFVSDKIKGLALTAILGGPFVALLLKIIHWGGDNFYLYVWGFTFVFSLFMMTLYPVVIMPMFNTYEPLPSGELKDRIYALAGRLNFPLTKLFVMDGSKRSSHSNAFMFGFFKNKRIVLFDTLMKQVRDDEILAILGHELGELFLRRRIYLAETTTTHERRRFPSPFSLRCDEVILSPSDRLDAETQ